jgi:hypothetical protein
LSGRRPAPHPCRLILRPPKHLSLPVRAPSATAALKLLEDRGHPTDASVLTPTTSRVTGPSWAAFCRWRPIRSLWWCGASLTPPTFCTKTAGWMSDDHTHGNALDEFKRGAIEAHRFDVGPCDFVHRWFAPDQLRHRLENPQPRFAPHTWDINPPTVFANS